MSLFSSILEYSSSLHVPHIGYLLISWRVLGYIHILAIVNRETISMTEHVSVK